VSGTAAQKRDLYAGALLMVLGAGCALEGHALALGTLSEMGPGFFPVLLGIALAVVGLLIAAFAVGTSAPDGSQELAGAPDWRGFACIVLGVVAFIALGEYTGLIPATFACVLIAAHGDRTMSFRAALVLALAMTVVAVVFFFYALQLQFPLLTWGRP
jgi:hypothetical protein